MSLHASGPAAAARKPIGGHLSKPGYTVIALAADGRASTVAARRGRFRLRPRADSVTLHLRAPDGVYAGPVVVRGRGPRALLGVRAGARLGRVIVRRGYARPARRLPARWVDATRNARARRGVPVGARVFGRVRVRRTQTRVPGDRDRDGIPNQLDVDDDGDLILDDFELRRLARASQAPGELVNSGLSLGLHQTVNANAAAVTTAQVDAALAAFGNLKLNSRSELWPPSATVELDCGSPQARTDPTVGGLVYCSSGGTGTVQTPGIPPSGYPPFPGDPFGPFDLDGDGFGTLEDPRGALVLRHGASSAQIGTGDVLIFHVDAGGAKTQFAGVVEYVFATVPALASYDDGQGHAATLSYPVVSVPVTGIPVAAQPNGDVVVRLTFWRPQRRPIPPEPGDWVDIGHLFYGARVTGGDRECPPNSLSESDPNLARGPGPGDEPFDPSIGGYQDLADDRPANPANTFTYTLNLTRCLQSAGLSFEPGEQRSFSFDGGALGAGADQAISFRRE